jgi:hypothetical protein
VFRKLFHRPKKVLELAGKGGVCHMNEKRRCLRLSDRADVPSTTDHIDFDHFREIDYLLLLCMISVNSELIVFLEGGRLRRGAE